MTLKEEFRKILSKDFTINQLEKIADDYAIEFSNWLFNINKEVLSKQLKEFKKEKGL